MCFNKIQAYVLNSLDFVIASALLHLIFRSIFSVYMYVHVKYQTDCVYSLDSILLFLRHRVDSTKLNAFAVRNKAEAQLYFKYYFFHFYTK